MRLLSTRRRHPLMRALFLALALFAMGALYTAVAPPTSSNADGGQSTQVEEGKALYQVGCSSCHGLQGEGTSQGPTLIGVGSASVDFQMATGRMPAAAPAAQMPTKPNRYTEAEIKAIAVYIDSLGAGIKEPSPGQYTMTRPQRDRFPAGHEGDEKYEAAVEEYDRVIARGGELFRTNCSACHNFEGKGGALPNGKYAPTLVGVDGKHIWEAMRTGPQQMPVFSQEVIPDEDARAIIAYLNELHESPAGGFDLGGLGPVSEGFWAWVIGIGGAVIFAIWITAKGVRAK